MPLIEFRLQTRGWMLHFCCVVYNQPFHSSCISSKLDNIYVMLSNPDLGDHWSKDSVKWTRSHTFRIYFKYLLNFKWICRLKGAILMWLAGVISSLDNVFFFCFFFVFFFNETKSTSTNTQKREQRQCSVPLTEQASLIKDLLYAQRNFFFFLNSALHKFYIIMTWLLP